MERQVYLTEPLTNLNDLSELHTQHSHNQKFKQFQSQSALTTTNMIRRQHSIVSRKKPAMNFQFPNEDYYDHKKAKPGIHIYKTILETQERRWEKQFSGPQLNLAIPETFVYYDNTYYLMSYSHENGRLEIQKNMNYLQYLEIFRKFAEDGVLQPSGVIINGNGISIDKTVVMSNDISLKSFPKNENHVVSRYVMPYRQYPNKLRLFFYPKNTRAIRKNYACKIVNKAPMSQQIYKRKYKLEHHFFVVPEKQDLCNVNMMHGGSISTCQRMTQSLTEYLEKAKGVKIFEMVVDFMIDQNKLTWFSEIKSIKSKNLTKIWDIGTELQIQQLANQKNNQLVCPLCEVAFRRKDMERVVTNKLSYELLTHLELRGADVRALNCSKLKNKYNGFTHVCDLCYELIVAEHKLINVQQQFSRIMNIDSNELQRVPSLQTNAQSKNSKSALIIKSASTSIANEEILDPTNNPQDSLPGKTSFYQWRMMIYIHKIKNIKNVAYYPGNSMEIEMEVKNGRLKDKFEKDVESRNINISGMGFTRFKSIASSGRKLYGADRERLSEKNEKLSSKDNSMWKDSQVTGISRSRVGYATNCTNQTIDNPALDDQEKLSISVQRVKIYIFYTDSRNISKFLQNAKINFSMKYCDEKFTGDSSTLQAFHDKLTCQRHSSEVYLFDEKYRYCNMEITTGLICDGEVGNVKAEFDYSPEDEVYFPKKNAFNSCKPLPDEWMEVFTDGKIPYSFEPIDEVMFDTTNLFSKMAIGMGNFCGSMSTNAVKSAERVNF